MENFEPCVHDGFCGGCIYQGVPYERQLAIKEGNVRRLLENRGIRPEKLEPIEGCPPEYRYRYRNKMEYTFGNTVKDGPLCLGMHRKKSFMSVVTVDHCQLVDEDFNTILRYTLDFAAERGYPHYNKKDHRGLLRHLVIRKGVRTGELLVNIVTTFEKGFDEEAYAEGLLALPLRNRLIGILRTFNGDIADRVKCEQLKTIWGRDCYMENILGLRFKVGPFSFFQTNVEAAERLYREVLHLTRDCEGKAVFDLYCGTGIIGQLLAAKAKEVTGVDIDGGAVEAARENACLNGLSNCKFIAGDVFEVLRNLETEPDIIAADPPRAGMGAKAVNRIAGLGAEKIVYISCGPKALADDLERFRQAGYDAEYVKPFDNFPMTKNVETVVLMSRIKD